MVTDELNRAPSSDEISGFKTLYDIVPKLATYQEGTRLLGTFNFRVDGQDRIPLFLIINTKTLQILQRLASPDPDTLNWEVHKALAHLDGKAEPPAPTPTLYDGRFTRDRWEMISQMALPPNLSPPSDPTNGYEGNSDAVALGKLLFDDTTLGGAGNVSCATCHNPTRAFADGLVTAAGVDPAGLPTVGDRNTPWLGGVAFSRFQFWDGRADSLWAQALGPFESDKEISGNRLYVVRTALNKYQTLYTQVFGAPPDLSDTSRFPTNARPGMPAWAAMTAADQAVVNRAFSNLGKALAAFERQILPLPVAIDKYAGGDSSALSEAEKDGLAHFFNIGCIQCHYGPMLQDGAFHSNYFPTGRQDGQPDPGLAAGIPLLQASEFRGDGMYSDAPASADWLKRYSNPAFLPLGQFKTSTLRGSADTAPYTHGGQKATLQDLVDLYAAAGMPDGDRRTGGVRDPAIVRFDKDDPQNQLLVQFLKTFKATVSVP